jgi:hypothetical protein
MVNLSDNIKEWDRNETIRLTNTFRDEEGTLYDPYSIELKIYNPASALYASVNVAVDGITKISTGVWAYDFSIPDDAATGWWIVKWTAVITDQTDVTRGQFYVRDPERRLYTQVSYVYSRAGQNDEFVSENDVKYFIMEAMGEVDKMMGKVYDYSTGITEWFDTSQPNENTKVTKIFLTYRPIRTITSVEEYDINGDLTETYTSNDYYTDDDTGMLGLYTKEFEHQPRRVKIVYNYGFDAVPTDIQQLTTVFAALKMLLNHIGSSVDDITSYSACGISLSVGEPYTASARAIELLTKEKDRLIAAIGRQRASIFIV